MLCIASPPELRTDIGTCAWRRDSTALRASLGVESFVSGMKAGGLPWLRSHHSQQRLREALLKAIAYSIHRQACPKPQERFNIESNVK